MKLKKISAIVAAVIIAAGGLAVLPLENIDIEGISITASALEKESYSLSTEGDFTITTDTKGNKSVLSYDGKGGDIRIPDGINSIWESAFKGNSKITSVTFPASCENVENDAFTCCGNLKKVVFEGNAAIFSGAFYMCPSLESVTINGSILTGIYPSAFSYCTSLKTVKISGNENEFVIGGDAFSDCYSLTSVNIPSKCTEIYPGAFINCVSLTNLTIPEKTKINEEGEYNSYHFGMYRMVVNGISDKDAILMAYPDLDDYKFVTGVADGKTSGYVYMCYAKGSGSGTAMIGDVLMGVEKITPKALTLTVTKGSPAEKWAKENKIKYTYASSSSSSGSKLAAPTGFKASKSQTKITLSWGAVEGADAYKVYMYNEKTGKYESYKNVANAKCTISGLKKGTKYKFKVAALVKKDGKYAAQTASKAVSVTTKK
ncbi:MAG: leucine-rich repeat protein [Oscillospiraceae bacterium]|nr:leucine-rich repeat protein [Oscillospiraceae bacterium]